MPTDISIVQRILDDAIAKKGRASKYGVVERIKDLLPPHRLHNKSIAAGRDTDDGIRNMDVGAKKVFSDCWRHLKKQYESDSDVLSAGPAVVFAGVSGARQLP